MRNVTWLYAGNSPKFQRETGWTTETISREVQPSLKLRLTSVIACTPKHVVRRSNPSETTRRAPPKAGEDIVRSRGRLRGCENRSIVKTIDFLKHKFFRIYFCKIYSALGKEQPEKFFKFHCAMRKGITLSHNEVLTRTNGVMIWVLSRRRAR